MLADAEFMYAAESEQKTRWVSASCRAIGIANVLLGRPDAAIAAFQEALMLYGADRPELALARVLCLGYLAFAAADMGAWPDARKWAQEAKALVPEHRLDQTLGAAIACTARATTLVHDGDSDRAAHELAHARRVRRLAHGMRWLSADLDLRWGNLSLDLGERLVAKEHAVARPGSPQRLSRSGHAVLAARRARDSHRPRRRSPSHAGRAPGHPVPSDTPPGQGDRRATPPVGRNGEDTSLPDLREVGRLHQVGGGREDGHARTRADRHASETRSGSEQEQSVDEQHARPGRRSRRPSAGRRWRPSHLSAASSRMTAQSPNSR